MRGSLFPERPKKRTQESSSRGWQAPLRQALDFYSHEKGWSNRLVSGDSLLVMNSLLTKESMGGKVQMIYIDPPYGIKYGSNFQPFTNKRDVKDRSDEDLTQEPEMIKAFRDTWELGIHSYLAYLRDRLTVARDLLTESGSIFVQIGDENVHLVRSLLDEVFGSENFVSFCPSSSVSRASNSDPLTDSRAATFQYSCVMNFSISISRSTTMRSATDCTRPAEREPGSLRHSTGDSEKPTR
jgi:hypothetical protein